MPKGIIVFGANGCGKSTIGRELAGILQYKHMDIEDYYFAKTEIPYSAPRSREECLDLLLADLESCGSFVLSAVQGDFGEKIHAMYECGVILEAPLAVRLERIKERAYRQFGERVREGGDMFAQEQRFYDFVAARSLAGVAQWAETLQCPVIHVDATKPVCENIGWIVSQYRALLRQNKDGCGKQEG